MRESVQEKVIIVTGAGSGIGRSLALMLSQGGWRVVLVGRRTSALEETAQLIEGSSGAHDSLICPTDIGDLDAIGPLVARVASECGRIDALVNNAGFAPLEPIGETSRETIERAFAVNAVGPAVLIRECWPHLVKSGGVVVNTSTKGTTDPFPGFFAYASSKAAVNLFAMSVAGEGAEAGGGLGVRGFSVAPGAVETGMLRGLFDEEMLPKEACLSPEDVARVMLDCIEGRRNQDNGRTIFIDRILDGSVAETVL